MEASRAVVVAEETPWRADDPERKDEVREEGSLLGRRGSKRVEAEKRVAEESEDGEYGSEVGRAEDKGEEEEKLWKLMNGQEARRRGRGAYGREAEGAEEEEEEEEEVEEGWKRRTFDQPRKRSLLGARL